MFGRFKKKKSPDGEGLAEWGAPGSDAPGAASPSADPQAPGAPAGPGASADPGSEPAAPRIGPAKAEGVWLALFANFDDPIRFEPVAALAESFTQGEDRAGFAAKKIGTRDDNLVQILLDEKAYAKGKADIVAAAERASERLEALVDAELGPGEYAGVAYPDAEGGVHQILVTPLDPESDAPSHARIDPGEDGEPVMTVAQTEPRDA